MATDRHSAGPVENLGISFREDAGERRPLIADTGLDVFEVIQVYLAGARDRRKLRAAFPWLTAHQIESALSYYAAHAAEIDAQIARNLAAMGQD